jgi:hypothetical protein
LLTRGGRRNSTQIGLSEYSRAQIRCHMPYSI